MSDRLRRRRSALALVVLLGLAGLRSWGGSFGFFNPTRPVSDLTDLRYGPQKGTCSICGRQSRRVATGAQAPSSFFSTAVVFAVATSRACPWLVVTAWMRELGRVWPIIGCRSPPHFPPMLDGAGRSSFCGTTRLSLELTLIGSPRREAPAGARD